MLHYEDHAGEGYVELRSDGKVDRASFDDVVAKLGPRMEEHAQAGRGKLGILKHVVSFGGIAPAVLWDDLQFAFSHLKHVGPVAVVSDKKWIEVWTKLAAPFWRSSVRFFEAGRLEEARAWLEHETRSAATRTEA